MGTCNVGPPDNNCTRVTWLDRKHGQICAFAVKDASPLRAWAPLSRSYSYLYISSSLLSHLSREKLFFFPKSQKKKEIIVVNIGGGTHLFLTRSLANRNHGLGATYQANIHVGWGQEQRRFHGDVWVGFGGLDAVFDGDACYVSTGKKWGTFNQDRKRGWHRLKPHRRGFRMVDSGKKSTSSFEKHGHLELNH
ncbi:hypothetical protein CRYUN_Cryun19dG0042500 [Craigia yunnanensis]